jgi:hypothetical protein
VVCHNIVTAYSFKYTSKMQRYTIFSITVNAVRVSGGGKLEQLNHASGSSKQA